MEPQTGRASAGPLVSSLQVYPTAEGYRLVLQVTNAAETPVDLDFRSGQTYDFLIWEGQRPVWRWSDDQMFTQALRRERMEAAETWRFEATWRPGPEDRGEMLVVP
jgi:hypothetical protein